MSAASCRSIARRRCSYSLHFMPSLPRMGSAAPAEERAYPPDRAPARGTGRIAPATGTLAARENRPPRDPVFPFPIREPRLRMSMSPRREGTRPLFSAGDPSPEQGGSSPEQGDPSPEQGDPSPEQGDPPPE